MKGKNKYIVRSNRYERKEPSRDSRKIYIYCEGNRREFDYFSFFCGLSTNVNIIPIPSKDGKTDPNKLKESAIFDFGIGKNGNATYQLDIEQHDNVWFVIDTDEWGDKIAELREFCKSRNIVEGTEAWFVSQSNPCFEIWLYYHFFSEKPSVEEVSNYSSLKKYVDAMVPGGFDSRKHPSRIETAISNAEAVYEEVNEMPAMFCSEVFKLGKEILPFVKEEL